MPPDSDPRQDPQTSDGTQGSIRQPSGTAKAQTGSGSPPWYDLAQAALINLSHAIQHQQALPYKDVPGIAEGIATSLRESDHLLSKALLPGGPSLIGNMIHVAIISVKIGMGLGYHKDQLNKLSLAALLHDLGMFLLPKELLETEGKWSKDQLAVLHRHPLRTAELVKPLEAHFPELPTIVSQEHERINGKGYPKGLEGNDIHEFAQIIGIADLLDAVLRTRPYRPHLLPYQAIRQVLINEKDSFPNHVIRALVEQCSMYPCGTLVRLNTGEVGEVLQSNPRFPLRPVVRVDHPNNPGQQNQPKMLDLSRNPLVHIMEVIRGEGGS